MKRTTGTLLAAALVFGGIAGQAHATITTAVTQSTAPVSANGLMSTVSGVTTITFNGSTTVPSQFSGAGRVVNGTNTGVYAAPNGDTSNFFAVGGSTTGVGTATFSTGNAYNYFGLYWGSIDAFNSVAFSLRGANVGTFAGTAFPPSTGQQTAPNTNEFVDFFFSPGTAYDTVTFSTTTPNFELDNVAFGQVPEPASIALLGAGLVGAVGFARRRKNGRSQVA